MNEKKYILSVDINHVEKRSKPSKHYVYCLWITWSDFSKYKIYRRYSQFYELQSKLLNRFKIILPILPPKKYIGRSHVLKVALERKFLIDFYCNKLISLQPQVSRCDLIFEFFKASKEDLDIFTQKKSSLDMGNISNPIQNKKYKCLHDFKSVTKSELRLSKNEIVDVHLKNLDGWWFVSNEYGEGFVPSIVLEPMEDFDKQEDEKSFPVEFFDVFIAKSDYEAKNQDEISLVKGNYVRVVEKRLDGWWKIESEGKIGLSPAICISEVNLSHEEKRLFFPHKSMSNLSWISSNYSLNNSENDQIFNKKQVNKLQTSASFVLPNDNDGLNTSKNYSQILNVQNLFY